MLKAEKGRGVSSRFGIACFVMFLFSPIIGLSSLLIGSISSLYSRHLTSVTVLLCSLFVALINGQKEAVSDLYSYFLIYEDSLTYSFYEFLFLHQFRDPFFYAVTYLLAFITGGDTYTYIFVVSFSVYYLLLSSLVNVARVIGINSRTTILLLLAMTFFGPLISVSGHILRQMLAAAFLVFFTSRVNIDDVRRRYDWILLVLSLLSHISVVVFFPLLMPVLFGRKKIAKFVNFLGLILFCAFFLFLMSGYGRAAFSGALFIGTLVDRSTSLAGADIDALSAMGVILILISLVCSASILLFLGKVRSYDVGEMLLVPRLIVFLSVFVLVTFQFGANEISTRYFFYVYCYFFHVLVMFLLFIKNKFLVSSILLVASIVSFYLSVIEGAWVYNRLDDLFLFPTLILLESHS